MSEILCEVKITLDEVRSEVELQYGIYEFNDDEIRAYFNYFEDGIEKRIEHFKDEIIGEMKWYLMKMNDSIDPKKNVIWKNYKNNHK